MLTIVLFSTTDDRDTEVAASTFEGKVLDADAKIQINACGRLSTLTGTTGNFDLVDTSGGDKQIVHFRWNCPYWASPNTWTVDVSDTKWMVNSTGGNMDSGPLGLITVDVLKKP